MSFAPVGHYRVSSTIKSAVVLISYLRGQACSLRRAFSLRRATGELCHRSLFSQSHRKGSATRALLLWQSLFPPRAPCHWLSSRLSSRRELDHASVRPHELPERACAPGGTYEVEPNGRSAACSRRRRGAPFFFFEFSSQKDLWSAEVGQKSLAQEKLFPFVAVVAQAALLCLAAHATPRPPPRHRTPPAATRT